MHDVVALADRFQTDGFVLVRQFLSAAEVANLDEQLERYIREVVPTIPPQHVFYESGRNGPVKHLSAPELYDDFFKTMLTRSATVELISACLDQPVVPLNSEVFYKPARVGSAAPYHQDNAYLHLEPAEGAVVWIALDDVTLENGAVHFAKGSHRGGARPHDETGVQLFSKGMTSPPATENYPEVPAVMQRGDASIHHILCAHCSGPNRTAKHRRGYVVNYKSARAQTDQARAAAHAAYVAGINASGGQAGAKV